jgi:hypothetical protein
MTGRVCANCAKSIDFKRPDARYCCVSCAQMQHRRRKGIGPRPRHYTLKVVDYDKADAQYRAGIRAQTEKLSQLLAKQMTLRQDEANE